MANSAQLRNEIAAGKWDDKLRALYGDATQEICRQRARYCAALEQFELYFGPGRQVQVYSAPGRAELGAGLRAERVQPEALGPVVGHVEVGPVPAEARREADGLPVARLVTSACVRLRVGEALGQQRPVAELRLPVRRQGPQRGGHRLRGQVGRGALVGEQEETAVLHHQLEPLDAHGRAPADPLVAVLERVTCRPPHQQRRRPAPHHDDLPQVVAHRSPRAKVMVVAQLRVEPLKLLFAGHGRLHRTVGGGS